MSNAPHILLIEAATELAGILSEYLFWRGYSVTAMPSLEYANDQISLVPPHIIIIGDVRTNAKKVNNFVTGIRHYRRRILITASRSYNIGPAVTILKRPFTCEQLAHVIMQMITS